MGLHERMEICGPLLVFGEPLAYLIDQHRSLDVAERKEFDEQLFLHRGIRRRNRSEEHTSELQSLMRISYAVFCLKKKKKNVRTQEINNHTMYNSRIQNK